MSDPWMKFYTSDWRADPALRMCSYSARGLWAEMMCIMHEAEPYGHLLVNGLPLNEKQLASLAGGGLRETVNAIADLESCGVFSRTEAGVIFSRRMKRDKERADRDKANGKRGGNPKVKPGVNPPVNGEVKAQIPEARYQNPESGESAAVAADPRADLFGRGLKALASMTGKTPDSCRALLGRWLKTVDDEAIQILGAIDDAERNRVVDPVGWITKSLQPRSRNGQTNPHSVVAAAGRLADKLASFGDRPGLIRGGPGENVVRLLPEGGRERPGHVHGSGSRDPGGISGGSDPARDGPENGDRTKD